MEFLGERFTKVPKAPRRAKIGNGPARCGVVYLSSNILRLLRVCFMLVPNLNRLFRNTKSYPGAFAKPHYESDMERKAT